ncbi:Uncharacterised protein [Budvicia aquatica]|uniref:Uncharacterized protein n=1 Tax=Budvicia aquatica TaxID=82979 RepID=A0A2C6DM41_9GAMM|nr:hypothetical protein CRN84_10965 [Budvicia aquatica]VFS48394.1 Uncharacterised protein [Budvicia aquatica]
MFINKKSLISQTDKDAILIGGGDIYLTIQHANLEIESPNSADQSYNEININNNNLIMTYLVLPEYMVSV